MSKFVIEKVKFPIINGIRLLKVNNRYPDQVLLDMAFNGPDRQQVEKALAMPGLTAEEVLAIDNTEQRMVAMKYFGMERLLNQLPHRIIDTQVISKNNKRWRVGTDGEMESYTEAIKDKYELIEVTLKVANRWTHTKRDINFYGVRCQCTTTGREYFIYTPPKATEGPVWSPVHTWHTDAIEAICQTFRVNVKPGAVKCYRRQGDVILTVVRPECKDQDYIGQWRTISKEEYLTKLESET